MHLAAAQEKPISLWPLRVHGVRADSCATSLLPTELPLQTSLQVRDPTGNGQLHWSRASYPSLLFPNQMALQAQGKRPSNVEGRPILSLDETDNILGEILEDNTAIKPEQNVHKK